MAQVTKECLLNPNRNPDLSIEEIENYLKNYLNVTKVRRPSLEDTGLACQSAAPPTFLRGYDTCVIHR